MNINNINNNFLYIVTHYGCNSSANDMWTPKSKLFINYNEAYNYFVENSPSLNDNENVAEQYINSKYNADNNNNKEYIVLYGYLEGIPNRAKRPYGTLIARVGIES